MHLGTNHLKDMNRIDGMPTEFKWKIFPGITTLGLFEKIQSLMRDLQCKPENFNDRIIFMSMNKDTNGVDTYVTESKPIAEARPRQKPTGTLTSVSIPVTEKKWIEIETQRSNDHMCFEVSKAVTRFTREGP